MATTIKSLSPAIEQPSSASANDVDGTTVAQDASPDEMLSADQLANVVAASTSTTTTSQSWLRTNSLNQALNYRGPQWLTGWENWVYLTLAVFIAGGLYWHFKK